VALFSLKEGVLVELSNEYDRLCVVEVSVVQLLSEGRKYFEIQGVTVLSVCIRQDFCNKK
tara:strand:+ start:335 stop:514 length:180 start_codon:yes stop_codon:yes gene_type:complete